MRPGCGARSVTRFAQARTAAITVAAGEPSPLPDRAPGVGEAVRAEYNQCPGLVVAQAKPGRDATFRGAMGPAGTDFSSACWGGHKNVW